MVNKWKNVKALKNTESIKQVEEVWSIKFPESYINVVLKSNAGVSDPNAFDTNVSKGKYFAELLSFNLDAKNSILNEYGLISNQLPADVFPFAADPSGNYICFDYRKDNTRPTVVFWNHEEGFEIEDDQLVNPDVENESELHVIENVADNFDKFLEKVYNYSFSFDDDDIENAVIL
jgi:hypothetical protein